VEISLDNLKDLSLNSKMKFECKKQKSGFDSPTMKSIEEKIEQTEISTFGNFVCLLNQIYASEEDWEVKKAQIFVLLNKASISTAEINKYTYWDAEKPYTRNLIATDGTNYTLLLLCWNPGKESKIHNHPCNGCFVKTVRGCLRESRYSVHSDSNEIRKSGTKFFCEDQVSFMHDDIGLHKIGNPSLDFGAISIHLYTPPFSSCKVWSNPGVGQLSNADNGTVGYFSVFGHRSPHLEGKSGLHSRLLSQLKQTFNKEE